MRTPFIVLLLVYFATSGHPFMISDQLAGHSAIVFGIERAETPLVRAGQVCAWLLACLLMLPRLGVIVDSFKRHKILLSIPVMAAVSLLWSAVPLDTLTRVVFLLGTVSFGLYVAEVLGLEEQLHLVFAAGCVASVLSILCVVLWPRYGYQFSGEWKGIFPHKNTDWVLQSCTYSLQYSI